MHRLFEIMQRIGEIDREIAALPPGSIATKKIKDKEYYYHRIARNKKRTETYIDFSQVEKLRTQIEKRKDAAYECSSYVRLGDQLKSLASYVKKYKKRECYSVLHAFVFGEHQDKVLARTLLHDRVNPIVLFQYIDKDSVNGLIKTMLDILDREEQTVEVDETHVYQIKEYLALLDLVIEVDLLPFPNVNRRETITILTQPGIRYAQANALVNSLLLDEKFNELSIIGRNQILERILSQIKGRTIEDIVLLETKLANPRKEVIPNHYRHLINREKCAETEHRFGTITGKYVIYRGEPTESEGIQYFNVEEYLKSLA